MYKRQAQILEIQTQSKTQADQERTAILARGRRAAEERLERLKSAAQLERRKLELAAKQEVLSEAFEQALEKLCALPEEEYIQLLTGMVLQACLLYTSHQQVQLQLRILPAPREKGGLHLYGGLPLAGAGAHPAGGAGQLPQPGCVRLSGDRFLRLWRAYLPH